MKDKWAFCVVAVAACVYLLKTIDIPLVADGKIMTDFRSFYFAIVGFVERGNIYDFRYLKYLANASGAPGRVFPYLYPPPMVFYLSPLAKLGVTDAAVLWIVLSVVFAVVVMVESMRLALGLRGAISPWQERLFAVLALFLFLVLPFDFNLMMGQVNIFVLAFIVASLLQALVFKREVLAGFLLVPAVLVKIIPLVILFFFVVNKRYRTLYGFAAGVVLFIVPTLLDSGGLDAWQHFLGFAGNMSYGKTAPGMFDAANIANFSVAGCVKRLMHGEMLIKSGTIMLLAFLGSRLLVQHKRMMGKDNRESLLLSYLILMIVAAPFTYLHHVIYIYPGLLLTAWLAMAGGNWRSYGCFALILGAAVICSTDFTLLYYRMRIHWHVFMMSLNLYALLFLFVLGLMLPKLVVAQCGKHKDALA